MTRNQNRTRGEQGIAIIMTALCLIPLMAFAAFGVDLASFYSRASYLQKAADAAALAGTVWMPNVSEATKVACDTLKNNGIDGGDCGTGDFVINIETGSTATSLLVEVTDPDAVRYFSAVLTDGDQQLTRSAEAEYNLPLPLGSPLNYFGGDSTQFTQPTENYQRIDWPADYSSRVPANRPCNPGTTAETGGWSATTFSTTGYSSSNPRCEWTAVLLTTRPANYDQQAGAPTNIPCNANASGNGRWQSGSSDTTAPTWNGGARYSSPALGNRLCVWSQPGTSRTVVPSNRTPDGCNRSGVYADGRFRTTDSSPQVNALYRDSALGTKLCRWISDESTQTRPVPGWTNPIPSDRSPGFWAMIHGPGHYAAQGDPFSARCLDEFNCSTVENQEYVSGENRGFWYVIDVPAGVSGPIDIRAFDAAMDLDTTKLIDNRENEKLGGGSWSDAETNMETEFRVYEQTNPLDFNARTALSSSSNNDPADGGCWWKLKQENSFDKAWAKLCTTSVAPGDRLLVNVRTNTVSGFPNSAGNNGYAMEVVFNGNRYANPGPNLYAYGAMGMLNRNTCTGTGCSPPPGTFYLAKIGPQYAGKTLVVELFDSGDVSGDAYVYPMMPNTLASGIPKPSLGINPSITTCNWTALPAPNPSQNTGFQGARSRTGTNTQGTPQLRDALDTSRCGVKTAALGTRLHNGEWLRIRVSIPSTYTCDVNNNTPETQAGSCWWGVRYEFANGGSSDDTTWSAKIDGNPVHLTE